jgi:peptidoglycan-associated lipoprotein
MKKMNMLRLCGVFALAVLLTAGCAQKPAPPAMTPTPTAQPSVTTEKPSQEPAGIKNQGMSETQVNEAARAAEAAQAAQAKAEAEAAAGLQRIHFNFDQFTLTPEARDILSKNATFIQNHPGVKVVVEGYCDERGSDEYNLALGQRRADAAKKYLITLGISPNRLSTISYGEERPLDPAHNEAAWAKNRRDEFKLLQ